MANHPPIIPAKPGDDADNPVYIFTEPRVGYRMPRGEASAKEEG